jgi:hypothetical protein
VTTCTTFYGGEYGSYIGEGGTVTVTGPSAGTYLVSLVYCDGSSTGRQADISVNCGTSTLLSFTPTGSFSTIGAMTVSETLNARGVIQ